MLESACSSSFQTFFEPIQNSLFRKASQIEVIFNHIHNHIQQQQQQRKKNPYCVDIKNDALKHQIDAQYNQLIFVNCFLYK